MNGKTLFNDDKKCGKKKYSWLDSYEKQCYEDYIYQVKNDPHNNWGTGFKALIVSDRCPGRAKGLYEYLNAKTDLSSVEYLHTLFEAQEYLEKCSIDILIYVGYQEDDANYQIKNILTKLNPYALTVMFANLDICIKSHCINNRIRHAYSSKKQLSGFIGYIEEAYSINKLLVSDEIERERRFSKGTENLEHDTNNSILRWFLSFFRRVNK